MITAVQNERWTRPRHTTTKSKKQIVSTPIRNGSTSPAIPDPRSGSHGEPPKLKTRSPSSLPGSLRSNLFVTMEPADSATRSNHDDDVMRGCTGTHLHVNLLPPAFLSIFSPFPNIPHNSLFFTTCYILVACTLRSSLCRF